MFQQMLVHSFEKDLVSYDILCCAIARNRTLGNLYVNRGYCYTILKILGFVIVGTVELCSWRKTNCFSLQ
jgi:hypothetical protein